MRSDGRRAGFAVLLGVLLSPVAGVGCSAILGLDEKQLGSLDGAPGSDANGEDVRPGMSDGANETTNSDAQVDASSDSTVDQSSEAGDAGTDGGGLCPTDDAGYHDIASPGCWTFFDTTVVNGLAEGFEGAAFDGRYVYFAPNVHAYVLRYDSQGAFADPNAWAVFDYTTVTAGLQVSFSGALFDGHWLYFVPSNGTVNIRVLRYDTTASFAAQSSWTPFDPATVVTNPPGFHGATFDGQYVYFAPYEDENNLTSAVVFRYDTQASFTNPTSWSTYDVSQVNAGTGGFFGALYDGKYVYLVPDSNSNGADGVVTRYDTSGPGFGTLMAWTTFDVATLNAQSLGFQGGAFDGTNVYLAPATNSVASQHGASTPLGDGGTWFDFALTALNPGANGYLGGAFDGRFVYLLPSWAGGVNNGIVVRYDTSAASFATTAAWSSYNTAPAPMNGGPYGSGAYDGRYLYLAPGIGSTTAARFDTKAMPSMPNLPAYHGSFY